MNFGEFTTHKTTTYAHHFMRHVLLISNFGLIERTKVKKKKIKIKKEAYTILTKATNKFFPLSQVFKCFYTFEKFMTCLCRISDLCFSQNKNANPAKITTSAPDITRLIFYLIGRETRLLICVLLYKS